jgi:hypothetical protein
LLVMLGCIVVSYSYTMHLECLCFALEGYPKSENVDFQPKITIPASQYFVEEEKRLNSHGKARSSSFQQRITLAY